MTRHQPLQVMVPSRGDLKHNGTSISPINIGFQQAGSTTGVVVGSVGRHAHSYNQEVWSSLS